MAVFTNQTRNSASFTNQTRGVSGEVLATAGLYYGFGCFSYSGGQILVAGTTPTFTNETRN